MTDSCAWHSFRSRDSRVDFSKIHNRGGDESRTATHVLRRKFGDIGVVCLRRELFRGTNKIRLSRVTFPPHHRLARAYPRKEKAAFFVPERLHTHALVTWPSRKVGIICGIRGMGAERKSRRKKPRLSDAGDAQIIHRDVASVFERLRWRQKSDVAVAAI